MEDLKQRIRHEAISLGFDDCCVAPADAPPHAGQFSRWLRDGFHGEMGYLARQEPKRLDPQLILPGARSLVTLAAGYYLPEAESNLPIPSATGLVARYVRFPDYHDILGERLKALASQMDDWGGPGTRSLWYVDTGPILERDFAERSGLGFVGKHTNLIHRRLGNWFFLAEILTTLELPPDPPARNRCGSCSRCLAACPTQAIVAPFRLDARRCISYLTIELKGSIPVELRSALGNRVFGCDDCLAVCPWNRFAQAARLLLPHARPDLGEADLLEWLHLDQAGFRARFAGTAMERTKLRGLQRNVCVALGNTGGPAALPALEQAAASGDPLVAEHARWAIDRLRQRWEQQSRGASRHAARNACPPETNHDEAS